MMLRGRAKTSPVSNGATGPWDSSDLEQLRQWDPGWTENCLKITTNPWTTMVLPRKTLELISLALNAACTNLNPDGTRRHIRAALKAGAKREEILMVLKMACIMSIHSCSLGAPILLEEMRLAGLKMSHRWPSNEPTPSCDRLKEADRWNEALDPFYELDPVWTDHLMENTISIYHSGVLEPKLIELLSIALDASYTHMYASGTRRHIRAALELGATPEEIMEVLKLCVAQGAQACNLGVAILADELNGSARQQATA